MELGLGIVIGAGVTLFLVMALAIARVGGVAQLRLGMTVAGRAGQDPAFAEKLNALLAGTPTTAPAPAARYRSP